MNPDKEIAPPFKMLKTKVLIIGGGPAGATAARYLSEAGIDTILAERDFSYTKPCAGAITVSGFHEFRLPDYLIQNRIHKVAVVLPSDKAIELKKDLCITDRCMLNQAMQSMAADKGTSLIEARFIGFGDRNSTTTNSLVKRKDDGIVVEIKSDYVLACDGVSFTVGRKCGIQTPARVYSISVQMHSFHGDACEFWLGSEYAGGKYCSWVFPTGEGASIGTGSDRSRELHDILDVFMKRRFGRSAKHLLEENLIGKTRIFKISRNTHFYRRYCNWRRIASIKICYATAHNFK